MCFVLIWHTLTFHIYILLSHHLLIICYLSILFMWRLSTDFALYQKRFTIFTCARPFYFMRRSHLLPNQLPREYTGDMTAVSTFLLQHHNLGKCTMFLHVPYCTFLQSGRSDGGWACSDNQGMFFYTCALIT